MPTMDWEATSKRLVGLNQLASVTCTSPANCWAVGDGGPTEAGTQTRSTLITYHWDGRTWSYGGALPIPLATIDNTVSTNSAVACKTAADCWIAGTLWLSRGTFQPIAWHWNGTSWKNVSLHVGRAALSSLACTHNSCWVVADDQKSTARLYQIVGTDVVQARGAQPLGTQLANVSCSTQAGCLFVGDAPSAPARDWIQRLVGNDRWTARLDQANRPHNFAWTVACSATCAIFNQGLFGVAAEADLFVHGTWHRSTLPSRFAAFMALACPTSSTCVAIGMTTSAKGSFVAHSTWRDGKWSAAS